MGYYEGQYENPCPRCGEIVYTLFISAGSMSFNRRCSGCKTESFTKEEEEQLGHNGPVAQWLEQLPLKQ